ncbi:MAG: PilZ domain-containing protein [Pseudomonadota bacterium]
MNDNEDTTPPEPIEAGESSPEVEAFISQATAAEDVPPDMPSAESHAPFAASVLQIPAKPNRRSQPRYFAKWRAALVVDGAKYFGKTENVSLTGVAITSPVNLRPKQELTLYLEVTVALGKPPEIFEAVAVVMHNSLAGGEFRLGVAFRFFKDDSQDILRRALRSGNYRQMLDPQYD